MWDKRESNTMYGGQNMNFDSVRPEVPFLPTMRFPPPNNSSIGQYFAEASRKRKSMHADPDHDGVSARFFENMGGNMGCPLQRGYALQHNVALPPPVDARMLFNHNPERSNPSNAESQYEAVRFYNMDNSFLSSETKDENIEKDTFGSFPPFHREEPSFPVHTLPVYSKHHDSKHPACDMANQYVLSKVPAHYTQHNGLMEMSQVAPRSDDGKKLERGNNSIPFNPCLYPFIMPSNNITTFGSSNLRVVNENFHSDAVSCGQMFSKTGLSEEKECGQVIRVQEARNNSITKIRSTQAPAFNEGREAYDLYQCHDTEMSSGSSIKVNLGGDLNLREQNGPPTFPMPQQTESSSKDGCLDHVSRIFETKILERNGGSNTENTRHQSGQESLLRGGNSLADRSVVTDDRLHLNLEECIPSVTGKVSPLIAEKLWDGSLQLSTSTTVSAVAFFKSGEKAQDTKWPEHVEIKGKVRLQAFEKFIQELPRSRNRTLMVISLCWKPGSPEAGLAGMKEVAKGYKEGQKVGFAQICPGLDLYVCPRSDTIITILAKYGFFKGMAAVVDDQDSLIGCVIWRRGHASSNPAPQISEKNQTSLPNQLPLHSPELSAPEINSPGKRADNLETKRERAPSPLISTLDKTVALVAENIAIQAANNFSYGSGSFHIDSVSGITPPIPYSSLYLVQPPSAQKLEPTSLQETVKHTDLPTTQAPESKKRDGDTELLQPIRQGPPQMLQGVQQQTNTQLSNGSQNFISYNICPPPEPRATISSNFTFIGTQLPTAQNLDSSSRSTPMQSNSKTNASTAFPGPATAQNSDSSYRSNPMQSNSKTESAQPILPGPPTAQNLDSSYRTNPMHCNLKPESARPTLPGPPIAQNLDPSYQLDPMQSNSKAELAQPVLPGPPAAQNFDSSYRLNPMPSISMAEAPQLALPGPPPLPPDILQRIIQFSREAHKATTEGVLKADTSFVPTAEPKKPSMVSEAEQKPNGLDDDDDDGDLPEFDFDSACGIPKAPESGFPGSSHQTHSQFPPFNQQVPVNVVMNETRLQSPPVVKSMDIRQVHASGSPGRPLNTYQGTTTTLPTRFGELNSEKKPVDVPSLSQQFPPKAVKGLSSSSSFSRKNRWDDDDDDMPEWCPPDMEHLDVPKPPIPKASENVKELPITSPSSMTTFHPPPHSQSFSHGYHHSAPVTYSAIAIPTPVQNRPAGGFVPIDFRPPQVPRPNPSMRPPTTNFGTRPPISDVSWQWKRH